MHSFITFVLMTQVWWEIVSYLNYQFYFIFTTHIFTRYPTHTKMVQQLPYTNTFSAGEIKLGLVNSTLLPNNAVVH